MKTFNENKRRKITTEYRFGRIFMAIFVAVFIWSFVNGNSNELIIQDIIGVPVAITNEEALTAKGLALVNNKGYFVNLRLRGSEKKLESIDPAQLSAIVDLGEITAKGSYEMKVEVSGLSNSVILEETKPNSLTIVVDDYASTEFDVIVNTNGRPAGDEVVVSATTNQKVNVDGLGQDLARIEKLVATANAYGLEGDGLQYVEVKAYDEQGEVIPNLDIQPSVVPVELIIGETKNVFISDPILVGRVADGYKISEITISPTNKTIGGRIADLDMVYSLKLGSLDVSNATEDVIEEMELIIPDGISMMDRNTKVTVTATVEKTIKKSFNVDKIDTKNIPEGLAVTAMNLSNLVVEVEGTQAEINEIKESDIEVWVDLTGKVAGKMELPIQGNIKTGEIDRFSPGTISITLE